MIWLPFHIKLLSRDVFVQNGIYLKSLSAPWSSISFSYKKIPRNIFPFSTAILYSNAIKLHIVFSSLGDVTCGGACAELFLPGWLFGYRFGVDVIFWSWFRTQNFGTVERTISGDVINFVQYRKWRVPHSGMWWMIGGGGAITVSSGATTSHRSG